MNKEIQKNDYISEFYIKTQKLIEIFGGFENIVNMHQKGIRLYIQIKDDNLVNKQAINSLDYLTHIEFNAKVFSAVAGNLSENLVSNFNQIKQTDFILKNNIKAKTWKQRLSISNILWAFGQIMLPVLPGIAILGLVGAVQTILQLTHVLPPLAKGTAIQDMDMANGIIAVMQKTGLPLLGILISISATRFFGGNIFISCFVALALMSKLLVPLAFGTEAIKDYQDFRFGKFVYHEEYKIQGWYLFSIGNYPILIKNYESAFLPFFLVGYLVASIHTWTDKWMPVSLKHVFTAPFVFMSVFLITVFTIGPATSLIEFGLTQLVHFLSDVKYGIGAGFVGLVYLPLLIFGLHNIVNILAMNEVAAYNPITNPNGSIIMSAFTAAFFAQMGVMIGVAIRTRNSYLRSESTSHAIAASLGIISPGVYAVSLPKKSPLLIATIMGGIGGTISGALGLDIEMQSNGGMFMWFGYKDHLEVVWAIILMTSIAIISTLLMLVFYKERQNEYKFAKVNLNKLFKEQIYSKELEKEVNKQNLENYKVLKQEFEQFLLEQKEVYKKYDSYILKKLALQFKVEKIIQNQDKLKIKLQNNINKTTLKLNEPNLEENKKDILQAKLDKYNQEMLTQKLNEKLIIAKQKANELDEQNQQIINDYKNSCQQIITKGNEFISNVNKQFNLQDQQKANNIVFNTANIIDISYGYIVGK